MIPRAWGVGCARRTHGRRTLDRCGWWVLLFEYLGTPGVWERPPGTTIDLEWVGGDHFEVVHGSGERWVFDGDFDDLVAMSDGAGQTVEFVRDGGRRLQRMENDTAGRALGFGYDAIDPYRLTSVEALVLSGSTYVAESPSRAVSFVYDEDSNLTSVNRPGGQQLRYTPDNGRVGRVERLVAPDTWELIVENTYADSLGGNPPQGDRVIAQRFQDGSTATYDYDIVGPSGEDVTRAVYRSSDGETETLDYLHDPMGRFLGIVDPTGAATDKSYDSAETFRNSERTDRRGADTVSTYDSQGRVWRVFTPDPDTGDVPVTLDDPKATQSGIFTEFEYVTCGAPAVCPVDDARVASRSQVVAKSGPANVFETTTYSYWEGTPTTNPVPLEVVPTGETRGVESTVTDGLVTQTRAPIGTGSAVVVTDYYFGADAPDAGVADCPLRMLCEAITAPGEDEESKTVYEYDDAGRVTAVIEAYGAVAGGGSPGATRTEYEYDPGGNLVEVRDPLVDDVDHFATRYGYDLAGRQLWVAGPGNDDTDGPGSLGGTDGSEPDTVTTYNDAGAVETVTTLVRYDGSTPVTETTLFEYDGFGQLVRETRAHGTSDAAVVEHAYGELGRLEATTVAPGTAEEMVTRFVYDKNGQQTQRIVDNPGGDDLVWGTGFDLAGRVVCEADPDDTKVFVTDVESVDYNQLDCDAVGSTFAAKYTYDLAGRTKVVEEHPGEGSTTQELEDASSKTEYVYDAAGRLFQTRRESGVFGQSAYSMYTYRFDVVEERSYDDAGRLLTVSVPSPDARTFNWSTGAKVTTAYGYDGAGRVSSVTEDVGGLAATTTTTYDPHGWVLTSTSPGGDVTASSYDALGRVVEVSRPSGIGSGVTRRASTFTPEGRLWTQTGWSDDPGSAGVVEYSYSANGSLDSVVDPVGTTVLFGYDLRGNRTSRVSTQVRGAVPSCGGGPSATCITESWEYDTADRLVGSSRPGVGDRSYGYDWAGRQVEAGAVIGVDRERRTVSNYTGSLLESVDYEVWDVSGTPTLVDEETVGYTYDVRGRRETMTDVRATSMSGDYDDARPVTYDYDEGNHLIRVSDAHTTTPTVTEWAWSIVGNPFRMVHPDGARFRFTHDNQNRLTQSAVLYMYAWVPLADYTYNADGEVTLEVLAGDELSYRSYERDAAGQVVRYVQDMDGIDVRETLVSWGVDGRVATECSDGSVSGTCSGVVDGYAYDDAGRAERCGWAVVYLGWWPGCC